MAVRPLNYVSLCTGGGGLDLALELAIPHSRPVLYVEREEYGCARLVAAIEEGLLAPAPVWSDARTLCGRRWRGCVDWLIGGIPCQPYSLAGARKGKHDERDLWPTARRYVAAMRPWGVLIENVPGMLSAKPGETPGALRVRRDLQRLGYVVEGGIFSASEVGFAHERQRFFLLAMADSFSDRGAPGFSTASAGHGVAAGTAEPIHDSSSMAANLGDADGTRRQATGRRYSLDRRAQPVAGGGDVDVTHGEPVQLRGVDRKLSGAEDEDPRSRHQRERTGHAARHSGAVVGDTLHGRSQKDGERDRQPIESGEQASQWLHADGSDQAVADALDGFRHGWPGEPGKRALGRTLVGRAGPRTLGVPGPDDTRAWLELLRERPDLEPSVRRGADGLADRVDELYMLGNGVVPVEGGYAIRSLVHALAGRGSEAAAQLVRMMETA